MAAREPPATAPAPTPPTPAPPAPSIDQIDFAEIRYIRVVGKGTFGVVWKALWRGTYVAVKNIESEAERKAFNVEARQLSRVSHPNIVKLYGVCTKDANFCLVMEFAEGGSLYNALHCSPKPTYQAAHAMSWARQCAEGVAYLHAMRPKPLIHRDLKPPNLLLEKGGLRLKICDFGTAADKQTQMTNNKGSAAWMAPEVFETSSYTEKCDVFSWGIILWEVLSRRKPFDEADWSTYRIMWAVHTGHRPPLLENCPPPIERLMTQCWLKEPSERPSMHEVVDIMTELCKYFPGADLPITYDSSYSEVMSEENDHGEDTLDYEFNSFEDSRQFSTMDTQNSTQSDVNPVSSIARRTNNQDNWNNNQNDQNQSGKISLNESGVYSQEFSNGNIHNSLRGGLLAVPNSQMEIPLQIDVDPNAWELNTGIVDDDEDMEIVGDRLELRNMAGFDKLVKPIKGNTNQTSTVSTGGGTNTGGPTGTSTSDRPNSPTDQQQPPEPDLESMHMMLDPHLRPVTPDFTNEASVQIYEQHNQLTKEYLKVQTELAYLSTHRSQLLEDHADKVALRKKREAVQLEEEKDSLVKLYMNLKRQLEKMGISPHQAYDDWVLVPEESPHE
ncbi:TGF-beta activated kinase 1 isoform X2 [Arctopsyche grandis]|uniref:TGF-beta activated kinase 1 isoform X2 n=1 Tax=Arctopsyche grandis TaxID=121162 RepID=UPI00406D79B9